MLRLRFSESDMVDGARSRHRSAIGWFVGDESHEGSRPMQIATIGLDIAKNVFQVHGVDVAEKVVVRKRLRRSQMLAFFKALPPCLVGMEACATAHYWARELTKLGHRVRLMTHQQIARSMLHQLALLFGRLQRDEPHGWPPHRCKDRIEVAFATGMQDVELQPEYVGCRLQVFRTGLGEIRVLVRTPFAPPAPLRLALTERTLPALVPERR